MPPPQVTEQVSHVLHAPQVQFTVNIDNFLTLRKLQCYVLPTRAAIIIAGLCICIISYTVGTIIHSRLSDCSVSFLSAPTTGCGAGFPCAPSPPGTVNWVE